MTKRWLRLLFFLALVFTVACSSGDPMVTPVPGFTVPAPSPHASDWPMPSASPLPTAPIPTQTIALTATPDPTPTPTAPAPTKSSTPTATPLADTTERHLRLFIQLWETVRDTYVYTDFNGLDWDDVFRRYREQIVAGLDDEGFYQAMREMMDELADDHSAYYSPQEVTEEEQRVSGTLDYVGIGVHVATLTEKGRVVLLQVFLDSPAERANLVPHDRILTVDGTPVANGNGEDQLGLLAGPAGSEMRLTVQTPGQEPRQVVLRRERVHSQLPVNAYRLPGTQVGYLMIPTFWDQTMVSRVRQALENLLVDGELQGLIVDMRINDGGLSTTLREMLSIFAEGELGTFVSRDTERQLVVEAQPVGASQELPLVILIGRETASFGEIFSGVLQETGRAHLVGRTTGGNVEILWRVDLEDGSRAWVAGETFRPPSGNDWELSGIVPDIEIPLDWDEFTEKNDPQLQAALDWLLELSGNIQD